MLSEIKIKVPGSLKLSRVGVLLIDTNQAYDTNLDKTQEIINKETPGFVVEPPSESYFDNSAGYVGYSDLNPTENQKQTARNNISAVSRQELTNAINQIINSGTAGGGSEIVLPISHSWLTADEDSYSVERGIVAARFAAIENFTNELKGSVITNVYKSDGTNILMKQTKKITRDPNTQAENITTAAEPIVDLSDYAKTSDIPQSYISDIIYEGKELKKKIGNNAYTPIISATQIVSDGGGSSQDTSNFVDLTTFNQHALNYNYHVSDIDRASWNRITNIVNNTLPNIESNINTINGTINSKLTTQGIDKSLLSSEVLASLDRADSAYSSVSDINTALNNKQPLLKGSTTDGNQQNIKAINGESILISGPTDKKNLELLPYTNTGLNEGVLTIGKNGQNQNAVISDDSIYMKYKGSIQDYETLPDSSTTKIGDTYFVEELNSLVMAKNVTQNKGIYVNIPTYSSLSERRVEQFDTDPQRVFTYAGFLDELDAIYSNLQTVIETFGNYPQIPYSYHNFSSNVDDNVRVVLVKHPAHGYVIYVITELTKKLFVVSDWSDGEMNTWYIPQASPTELTLTDLTNQLIKVTFDDLNLIYDPAKINAGIGIKGFYTFGGGVEWTRPNDMSTKTVNGMSLLGKGNVLITPNNSVYSATGNINSPIITDSASYDDIDVIINYGFVPVFKDENGYYFHLWKHDTESLESTYEFANWIEDNNSITFKVYSIADAADSIWNARTISLT